jgi:integrase
VVVVSVVVLVVVVSVVVLVVVVSVVVLVVVVSVVVLVVRDVCAARGGGGAPSQLGRPGPDAMPARYRALVLVLGFGGLRFGEATALTRPNVSDDGSLVTVERSVRYVSGSWLVGPPKTDAGRRTVALPGFVAKAVARHLRDHAPDNPDAPVFATASGGFLAGSNFGKTFARAVESRGLPPARVHWLRHTGATLAASAGASTKDLMHRLGHVSPDAALGYQHAASTRDSEIARALDALVNP